MVVKTTILVGLNRSHLFWVCNYPNPVNLFSGRPANNYHPWMILYNNKYPNFSIICTEDNRRMVSTYMGTFELVGFDATHEERMTLRQSLHEQLKWLLELEAEGRRSLQRLDTLQQQTDSEPGRGGGWLTTHWKHWLKCPKGTGFEVQYLINT